jgi:hypothetical protein
VYAAPASRTAWNERVEKTDSQESPFVNAFNFANGVFAVTVYHTSEGYYSQIYNLTERYQPIVPVADDPVSILPANYYSVIHTVQLDLNTLIISDIDGNYGIYSLQNQAILELLTTGSFKSSNFKSSFASSIQQLKGSVLISHVYQSQGFFFLFSSSVV